MRPPLNELDKKTVRSSAKKTHDLKKSSNGSAKKPRNSVKKPTKIAKAPKNVAKSQRNLAKETRRSVDGKHNSAKSPPRFANKIKDFIGKMQCFTKKAWSYTKSNRGKIWSYTKSIQGKTWNYIKNPQYFLNKARELVNKVFGFIKNHQVVVNKYKIFAAKIVNAAHGRWNVVFGDGDNVKEQYFVYESDEDSKIFGGLGHFMLWTTAAFIIIMLIWAKFAILDEVTVAQGQVISSSKTQVIQNLEGGIVEQVLVKEGQTVEKGQILVRMSDVKFTSAYRENRSKEAAMHIKIARLQAELNGSKFQIAPELEHDFPNLVASEWELYNSRQNEMKELNDTRLSLMQEVKMNEPLVKEGVISKVELMQLEQRLDEVDGNIGKFRSTSLQELNAANADLSGFQDVNATLLDQLNRTKVRSPVRGIVKQVYINTAGGVVNPGMPLVDVVPLDDTLLIEAKVRPQDIGFLRPDQDATVKITAYDFGIYGGLKGKVEHIGADTETDQKGNSFYEVWVRTDRNYIDSYGKKMQIIPGMQASVNVLTGHQSVLDYVLKPILKTRQAALHER